jgi:hypothetical protein
MKNVTADVRRRIELWKVGPATKNQKEGPGVSQWLSARTKKE